jgi:hypothetical protein
MAVHRCPVCTFYYIGPGPCPLCAVQPRPGMYVSWASALRRNLGCIIIYAAVLVGLFWLHICIAAGQEPCPPQSQRIEYYTTDDGRQVPFTGGNITAHHDYPRTNPTRSVRYSPVSPATQRQSYRPEVRQSPFPSSTRTINARVADRVSTPLADFSATGSIRTRANTAGLVGDTSQHP